MLGRLPRPPLIAAVIIAALGWQVAAEGRAQPNVLFIAVDDLRPSIGAYGDALAVTPNLDALATAGALFEKAYCQQAVCSPSRTSVLTGLRPDSTKVYDLKTHFRENVPDAVTLPQHFRRHGYRTVSVGKILHGGLDDAPSWDEVLTGYTQPQHVSAEFRAVVSSHPKHYPAYECLDVPDNTYSDGRIAEQAVAKLGELKQQERPWFFAVGFYKPHLPFVAPSKYWDLHDRETLWPPPSRKQPVGAPSWSGHPNWELANNRYSDDRGAQLTNPLGVEFEKTLRHGYYACASYADAQIGKLMTALEAERLDQETIVVVWGDHGYHVGDMGFWCKHNNYEWATHSPLILRVPGKPGGQRVSAPVEFIDIYPTLASVCGLPAPDGVEGGDLSPLLSDPTAPSRGHAFSQYDRNAGRSRMMGYSVRTPRWRYTEWIRLRDGKRVGRELYDFETDPLQTQNHCEDPKLLPVVKEHARLLDARRPPSSTGQQR